MQGVVFLLRTGFKREALWLRAGGDRFSVGDSQGHQIELRGHGGSSQETYVQDAPRPAARRKQQAEGGGSGHSLSEVQRADPSSSRLPAVRLLTRPRGHCGRIELLALDAIGGVAAPAAICAGGLPF